jgi:hypothetical protein
MSCNQNVGCYSNITLNNAVDIYREMTVCKDRVTS